MANWYGASRSNYFKVKDAAAFEAKMAALGVGVVTSQDGALAVLGSDEGYWPSCDPNTDEDIEFIELVAGYLADDEVAIFITSGAEKLRYISGYATAVNNKLETRDVNLNDIYKLAEELGPNVTEASY